MAIRTVKQPKLWLDEHELSPLFMSFNISATRALQDATTLADGAIRRAPGLASHSLGASGYLKTDAAMVAAAEALEAGVGASDKGIWTIAPTTKPVAGDPAYLLNPRSSEVNALQGAIGETSKIDIAAEGDGNLARGILILDETIDEDSGQTQGDQSDNTAWTPVHGGGDLVVHLHVRNLAASGAQNVRVRRATSVNGANAASVIARVTLSGANAPPFTMRGVFEDAPAQVWVQLDWDVGSAAGEIMAACAAGRAA